jgi:hypothetical protein
MRRGTRAFTFVEVVVTIALLLLFVSLVYPILYSVSRGYASHHAANDVLEARLSVTTRLAAVAAQVTPPYWENPDSVFTNEGSSWTAHYWHGDHDKTLVLSQESPGRLKLTTDDGTLLFDHLPPLTIDWWKKDGRTLGWQIQGLTDTKAFHVAWGSFLW